MEIPLNIQILLIFVLIAGILYMIKTLIFRRMNRILPSDVRKTEAYDGHDVFSSYEASIDNFLYASKLPHNRPKTAKYQEYYQQSSGVPHFIVFKSWEAKEIHSLIEIIGMPKIKKIESVIHSPEHAPLYPVFKITMEDLQTETWKTNAYKFYKELREDIKKWAENEENKAKFKKFPSQK